MGNFRRLNHNIRKVDKMEKFEKKINTIETIVEMEKLFEEIALDDSISDEEYITLYNIALNKLR